MTRSDVRVAVVGGGLAGLAASAALAKRGLSIELFEMRRYLGGRVGSFLDSATGQLVDHCQHVAMGCCTNFIDFSKCTEIEKYFRRDRTIHFFGPSGKQYDFTSSRLLPKPFHLGPAFMKLRFLSFRERYSIAKTLFLLSRTQNENKETIGRWLRINGQTDRMIERFWSVVLVSALSETVDCASVSAAKKVFVDGFLADRNAYHILVPTIPLGRLYDQIVADWLTNHDVKIHLRSRVKRLHGNLSGITSLESSDDEQLPFDFFVVALPWQHVNHIFPKELAHRVPEIQTTGQIKGVPITSVHLWFDRPIMSLPHAALIGRDSQWIFNRGKQRISLQEETSGYYYQIVISASRNLTGRHRDVIIDQVLQDLKTIRSITKEATLLHSRLITQQDAVFSPAPGIDAFRPTQSTSIPNLMLAGDWTQTGWPATMEGAVRSGYLAAELVLRALGRDEEVLIPDLSSPG